MSDAGEHGAEEFAVLEAPDFRGAQVRRRRQETLADRAVPVRGVAVAGEAIVPIIGFAARDVLRVAGSGFCSAAASADDGMPAAGSTGTTPAGGNGTRAW